MADDWFRVEVSDGKGQIVAIEEEMLAGRDIGDSERETIFKAIRHLIGFSGAPFTETDDEPRGYLTDCDMK